MKKLFYAFGIVLMVLFFFGNANAINLLNNGGFEDNSLGAGGWAVYDTLPGGWYTGPGDAGIEVQYTGTVVTAHEGEYYVELDSHGQPNTNSSLIQDVVLTAGDYELSFWYHPRTNNDGDDNGISVSVEVGALGPNAISLKRSEQNYWEEYVYSFTVTTPDTYKVIFEAFGTDNTLGGFIDDVNLKPVPEPGTIFLLGFGLIGLATAYRRKK